MSSDYGSANLLPPIRSQRGSKPELRRLSSTTARPVDLYAGNVTVTPEHHQSRPSDAHETALALERAKYRLEEEPGESIPDASTGVMAPEEGGLETTNVYAFPFDIDSVLIKGEVIPEAKDAMEMLNGAKEYNIKV